MTVQLLIEALVRQTTILIAQLATSGGTRAPLVEIANQVFVDLVHELENQGVSRKVAADMFGLGLRTYRRKIQRLSESTTERGRSLWEAVYDHIAASGVVSRGEVLARFHHDDGELVRGVLQDLTETGMVFRAGIGVTSTYRATTREEMKRAGDAGEREGLDALVWGVVYRDGPLDLPRLAALVTVSEERIAESIGRLVAAGRVLVEDGRYRSRGFVIPAGAPFGWEAAVFDHMKAVVQTICSKLRQDTAVRQDPNRVGGSTYTLEVWPGHPFEDAALSELARFRERLTALRTAIAAHNAAHSLPPVRSRVVVYGGQCVLPVEDGAAAEE